MSKIPFDGSKVYTSLAREFCFKKIEELARRKMDDKTKATLEELLDKVRTGPSHKIKPPPVHSYSRFDRFDTLDMEARAREREILAREISARAEEATRRAAWIKRDAEAAEERTRRANEPARFESSTYLLSEVACVSVNSAKACVVINCPISRSLYDLLVDRFKGNKLKYDAKLGVWEAHPSIMPELRPILKSHFKDVQVLGVPKALPATKFDQLIAKLDKDDKSKIYKLLALKYHTDRGGSHDTMVLVNQVFKES